MAVLRRYFAAVLYLALLLVGLRAYAQEIEILNIGDRLLMYYRGWSLNDTED
jgi:hypothetical protein